MLKNIRKRCECPFTEYLFAKLFQNNSNESIEQIKNQQIHYIKNESEYISDLDLRGDKEITNWINKCQKSLSDFKIKENLILSNFKVFLTGKKIEDPTILSLNKHTEKKQNKADVFVLIDDNKWMGFSVKTTSKDPLSNWSIEKLIGEKDPALKTKLKEIKKEILLENGIDRNWRENKEENRKKYNKVMYGTNKYKELLDSYIINSQDHMKEIIAEAAGSSITNYRQFLYNGTEIIDLQEVYNNIKKSNELKIIRDNSDFSHETLKSHYSPTSAKLWYYVSINKKIEYRFEIRWKGEPYASPQLLLIKL